MLKARKLLIDILVLPFVIVLNPSILQAEERCFVRTVTANVEYKDTWLLQWDPDNPEKINRNSSVSVKVIGGWKNFSWSVSGNDFWFDSAHTITSIETDSRTVTVYAGSSACGAATITVTDSRNGSVTGYLRCTYGQWVLKSTGVCEMPGPFTLSYWVAGRCERIAGKGWQKQWICQDGTCIKGYELFCPDDCQRDDICDSGSHPPCHATQNCLTGNWRVDEKCNAEYLGYNQWKVNCYCIRTFEYREWECVP